MFISRKELNQLDKKIKKYIYLCDNRPDKWLDDALSLAIRLKCDYDFIRVLFAKIRFNKELEQIAQLSKQDHYRLIAGVKLPNKQFLIKDLVDNTNYLKGLESEDERKQILETVESLERMLIYTVLKENGVYFNKELDELREVE